MKVEKLNGWSVLADFAPTLGLALLAGVVFSLAAGAIVVVIASAAA